MNELWRQKTDNGPWHKLTWRKAPGELITWNDNTPPLDELITVKNWQNLPICNPKLEHHNINAHTRFDKNPLILSCYHLEMKIRTYDRWTDVWQMTEVKPQYPATIGRSIKTVDTFDNGGTWTNKICIHLCLSFSLFTIFTLSFQTDRPQQTV